MFDHAWELATTLNAAGAAARPGLLVPVVTALILVVGTLAAIRGGSKSVAMVRIAVVLALASAGWLALDQLERRDLAAERRALDTRAFELAVRALAPGSALACLGAVAGEMVEKSCEKALFASPETTAAAVSYVAAQLSLLAADGEHGDLVGPITAMATLRRAIEADRFGIVAHVLAVRDGCTPAQCGALDLLSDASAVRANLAERPFETHGKNHVAAWSASPPMASSPPTEATAPARVAGAKVPNNLYFPSAASIPPVSIMAGEPAGSQQQQDQDSRQRRSQDKPREMAGDASTTALSRKPPSNGHQARQPPTASGAPGRSAPVGLVPPAQ